MDRGWNRGVATLARKCSNARAGEGAGFAQHDHAAVAGYVTLHQVLRSVSWIPTYPLANNAINERGKVIKRGSCVEWMSPPRYEDKRRKTNLVDHVGQQTLHLVSVHRLLGPHTKRGTEFSHGNPRSPHPWGVWLFRLLETTSDKDFPEEVA